MNQRPLINCRRLRKLTVRCLIAGAFLATMGKTNARASDLVADFTGNTGLLFQANSTFGWSFTVNQPIRIDRLGFFDDFIEGGPGLRQDHQIRIWTDDGTMTQLTSTIVTDDSLEAPSTAVDGQWKYEEIAPIVLSRGDYVIGADDPACNSTCDRIRFLGTINTIPAITYGRTRNTAPAGFPGATTPGREDGNFGPTFWATPLPGPDFNFDDRVSCLDVDALVAEIASGTHGPSFDMNGDGSVDLDDLTEWRFQAGHENLGPGKTYLLGDANLDGNVDGQDFVSWNMNKFSSLPAWCSGDFDASGEIDGQDFVLWNANKFTSADLAATPVPESNPALWWLSLLGLFTYRTQKLGRLTS